MSSYAVAFPSGDEPLDKYDDISEKWIHEVFDSFDEMTVKADPKDKDAARHYGIYYADTDSLLMPGRFMSERNWEIWIGIRNKWDANKLFAGYLQSDKFPINWNGWEGTPPKNRVVY